MTAQTRGFLFSDLRGYSAYTERHGDRAARELLTRYRRVVRDVISRMGGAEIRTEGDSFYVVFDSVSDSVHAGIAILAAVEAENDAQDAHRIAVGIGVHAGEAEDSDEGIISSAVNTAARICAVAAADELLVSDTVRSLTRTYIDVQFVPAGRRRLKGIAEQVALYRVHPAGSSGARRPGIRRASLSGRTRSAAIVGGVAVASVVVALLGAVLLREAGGQTTPDANLATATPASTTSPSAVPAEPRDARFPTADEARHLQLVDDAIRDRCARAVAEDGPRYRDFGGLAREQIATAPWERMSVLGGVHCSPLGVDLPHSLWYWQVVQTANPSAPLTAEEWIVHYAGNVGAEHGTCEADGAATLEAWSISGRSGRLLCWETITGDAILFWTYDGLNVVGKALREDRNMQTLLEWWRAEARLAVD